MDMCDECFIYDYLCVCVRFACGRSLVRFQYSPAQKFCISTKKQTKYICLKSRGGCTGRILGCLFSNWTINLSQTIKICSPNQHSPGKRRCARKGKVTNWWNIPSVYTILIVGFIYFSLTLEPPPFPLSAQTCTIQHHIKLNMQNRSINFFIYDYVAEYEHPPDIFLYEALYSGFVRTPRKNTLSYIYIYILNWTL